jgi:uncharacterized protein (TIGR02453 family)
MPAAAKKPSPNGFQGFGPRALDFFKALAFHQSKEWFLENKSLYESDVKGPLALLIADLSAEFASRGIPLAGQGERSIFRIHRDIRFSKDKSPYKTHAGATLTRDGGKLSPGLFYIHVSPEGSFAAAGFWQPETAHLAAIRTAVQAAPRRWLRLEEKLKESGLTLSHEDRLTRLPKGFESAQNTEIAGALKLKSFVVRRPIDTPALFKTQLLIDLLDFADAALLLLDFGWAAIDKRNATAN